MAGLELADFAPLCGKVFDLRVDDGSALPLRLVEARALSMAAGDLRQPFSILFEGPPAPLLPQRIYSVGLPGQAANDLFLVPVGADVGATRYQAIFT